jgi:hypothetical protein
LQSAHPTPPQGGAIGPLRARTSIVLLVLVAATGACSSSAKTAAPTTPSSTAPAPTAPAPTAPAAIVPTTIGSSSYHGSDTSAFCNLARHYVNALPTPAGATQTPPRLEALYQNLEPELARAEGEAPNAIKADFHTFVIAEDTLLDAFKAADYNYENLAPTAFEVLDAAPVATAGSHISAYMQQVCGIPTTTK